MTGLVRRVIAFDQAWRKGGVVALNCPSKDVVQWHWADFEHPKHYPGEGDELSLRLALIRDWASTFISAWMFGLVDLDSGKTIVVVESIFAKGVQAAFTLARAQAAVMMAAADHHLPVMQIHPATVQAHLRTSAGPGVKTKSAQFKRASILTAKGAFGDKEIPEDVADAYHIGVVAIGKLKEEWQRHGGRGETPSTRGPRASRPVRDK